jgi:Domain of unknown function (DUF4424)
MKATVPFLAAAALATPLLANDSVAEHAAGGLVLSRSADIDMESEDLFVSASEVRVAYVFRNRTAKPVAATIAFPLPDQDLAEDREGDVAYPSGFSTRVDGRPVAMRVERKAVLKGADRTAELRRLGLPITGEGAGDALGRLPKTEQARLLAAGLADVDEYDAGRGWERHLVPMWTVKETWYWEQVFPAGRALAVEHRYKPGAGESVGTPLTVAGFRASPEGRSTIARYCLDDAFLAGVDRLARRAGGDGATLPETRIGYVLTTGANWRAPIGRFRLVVDKGAADNLVSFCADGVRKISPTRFETVRTDWRPARDLAVLIVKPQPR